MDDDTGILMPLVSLCDTRTKRTGLQSKSFLAAENNGIERIVDRLDSRFTSSS